VTEWVSLGKDNREMILTSVATMIDIFWWQPLICWILRQCLDFQHPKLT